jgi:hypothetical protein
VPSAPATVARTAAKGPAGPASLSLAGDLADALAAYVDSVSVARCDNDTFPPAPPDPDPPTGDCEAGYVALPDFWDGWCGDEGRNFGTVAGSAGSMASNALAVTPLPAPLAVGWFSVDIYFATDRIPEGGGGKHLISPNSWAEAWGDQRPPRGWLRPDITTRKMSNGQYVWRIDTYNSDGQGNRPTTPSGRTDWVVDVWQTSLLIPGVRQWIPVRFDWRHEAPDRLWMRLTAGGRQQERTIWIHPDSNEPAYLTVGNMDDLGSFGGTPQVWFRDFKTGP